MAQPARTNVTPLALAKPSASVVMVDPATAQRWLDRNTHNRPLSPGLVTLYARDMKAGKWQITGEAVKFAADGTMLDGQHRCAAVVKSGVTVPMFVVRGLSVDVQSAMDTGRKRSASDALHLTGEKNTSSLAGGARYAIGVQNVGHEKAQWYKATTAEIAEFIADNPDIREAADIAVTVSRRIDCTPSLTAYAYWRLARVSRPSAAAFFTAAANKVGLADGDPVIALTNTLADARRARKVLPHAAVVSCIFRAWNTRRDGRTMRVVKVNSTNGGLIPVPEPR